MPDGQTLKDRATQLLIKYKSGALVTKFGLLRNAFEGWMDLPQHSQRVLSGT